MGMSIDLQDLASRLRRHVETLAGEPRSPDTRAHREAREYITRQLEAAGLSVWHNQETVAGLNCRNVLTAALPEAANLPLFIIGAHYDSVPGSPGADDNASAVAALLEIARLSEPFLRHPSVSTRFQFCGYDLEEYGFLGSTSHADELKAKAVPLRGMISLEMVGYTDARPGSQQLPPNLAKLYPDVGTFIGVCGNEDSLGLVQLVTESLKTVAGLPVECIAVPGRGETLPPVRLSDHSSFWDQDYQALMITDTSVMRNPHYHQPSDTPDTLDYPFLAKVTAGMVEAVRRLAFG
jgi:Zn-dependent M28 family amino/carboxypeptidase